MDYDNYDALGNIIREDSGDNTTTAVEVVSEPPRGGAQQQTTAHQQKADDGDSDGWSDVEIIADDGNTDDAAVPLVQSVGYNAHLTSSAVGAAGAEILLLTGGPSSSSAAAGGAEAKSESQKHADAINFIVGATSKLRNVAIGGDLHSGKSSLARLLATAAAEVEGQFDELTKGKSAKQRHFGTSATPKGAAASALIPFQGLTEQEHARRMTLRSNTFSCLVSGERRVQTTHLVTMTDTPGHPSLVADALSALRVADTLLLCVDASGAFGHHAEQLMRRAVLQHMRVVLVLTKIDRLIVDLHLPPQDAYSKLRAIIDSVNNVIASCGAIPIAVGPAEAEGDTADAASAGPSPATTVVPLVSPVNNTVWFTSAKMNMFFTVESFAHKYSQAFRNISPAVLAPRLWGPVRFDSDGRKFAKVTAPTQRHSFVTLVLEPLYKIISHSIAGEGFWLLNDSLSESPKGPWAAAREAVTLYLGSFHKAAVDALLGCAEAPRRRSAVLRHQYQIDTDDEGQPIRAAAAVATSVLIVPTASSGNASAAEPSVAAAASSKGAAFADAANETTFVLARVINAVLKKGDAVTLVDQRAADNAQTSSAKVDGIFVRTVAGLVEVPDAVAGMTVYLKGIAAKMAGPHCLIVVDQSEQTFPIPAIPSIFGGLAASSSGTAAANAKRKKDNAAAGADVPSAALDAPLLHVNVQPLVAKDLRAFEKGVRKMTMKYPGLTVALEETGLYTLSGIGELQFEAALTDLRRYDTKHLPPSAIKLSSFVDRDNAQPFVTFCETVAERRGVLAVHPPSRHRDEQLAMTAQRVPERLSLAIEHNALPLDGDDFLPLFSCLRNEHGWDILAASRGLISIGPDRTKGSTNILVDDSIEGDWLDEPEGAEAVVEGFRAATLKGPLCDSAVRDVHFKLIGGAVPFSQHLAQYGRLCAHKAMLGASPRLVEPVFAAEILTQPSHVDAIRRLLEGRRGNLVGETKIPASPLVLCKAYCPAIDHFGLETQLRVETNGEAFPTFAFDHWAVIESDPYDATVALELLQPARGHKIARDFVLKTRMRKGLRPKPEDVDIQ